MTWVSVTLWFFGTECVHIRWSRHRRGFMLPSIWHTKCVWRSFCYLSKIDFFLLSTRPDTLSFLQQCLFKHILGAIKKLVVFSFFKNQEDVYTLSPIIGSIRLIRTYSSILELCLQSESFMGGGRGSHLWEVLYIFHSHEEIRQPSLFVVLEWRRKRAHTHIK